MAVCFSVVDRSCGEPGHGTIISSDCPPPSRCAPSAARQPSLLCSLLSLLGHDRRVPDNEIRTMHVSSGSVAHVRPRAKQSAALFGETGLMLMSAVSCRADLRAATDRRAELPLSASQREFDGRRRPTATAAVQIFSSGFHHNVQRASAATRRRAVALRVEPPDPGRRLAPSGCHPMTQPGPAGAAGIHTLGVVACGGGEACLVAPRYHAGLALKVFALGVASACGLRPSSNPDGCAAPWCFGLGQSRPISTGVQHVVFPCMH
ncbi:hypothetical protein BurJ1DRAFT_2360 [Burkholderiales bacterium JOSHI_001]|nr:hypothetical protein BurJ1DRAFT_2360 [Burkholderiales bacterium JOSHI_001]